MLDLKPLIHDVPDFPKPGILFRDISPLLRDHMDAALGAMTELLPPAEWQHIDALAGIESRGFVLAAGLAARLGKGFVMVRKFGKLPPPTIKQSYALEYGTDTLEVKPGTGRIVLVDDVLATGGTLAAAANLCRKADYQIGALLVLIDLGLVRDFNWQTLPARAAVRYG
jgi:adenine phosphoribosyltransferase